MIDISAPIIPFEGMGNIKLYSTIEDLSDIISRPDVTSVILNNCWIRYDISNTMMLFFHLKNRKLFKICTQEAYAGKLYGVIDTSTHEDDFTKIDPEIIYDDFEEVWESPKGYFIETDAETGLATWINVFIKETLEEDFEEANW